MAAHPTTVVRIRRSKEKGIVQDCDVYIGRRMTMGGWNLLDSIWRNPYPVKKHGLEKSLELYEEHLRASPELLAVLPELVGKSLGCWCKPKACHGDILLKVMKERGLI
jgi:hypothetical protein